MEAILIELQKLRKININVILFNIISKSDIQTFIKNLIRIDQLFKEGVSEENVIIGYYSPYTESLYPDKKAGTHYTLKLTGAFYNSFTISPNETFMVIDADGDKGNGKNLFEIYNDSGNFLGLTETSMEKLQKYLIPLIVAEYGEQLGI